MDAAEIIGRLAHRDGRNDPYPLYTLAHGLGPVSPVAEGWVLACGYDSVNRVLRNPAFGVDDNDLRRSRFGDVPMPDSLELLGRSMLQSNPPLHTRMRAPVASVFTPRRVAALEPVVAGIVERLLDRIGGLSAGLDAGDGRGVDFIEEFAYQLPVSVICELLGVPEDDRGPFRSLVHDLTQVFEFMSSETDLTAADAAARELRGYFATLAELRRAAPGDDLVTALVQLVDAEDARLDAAELLGNLVLLLVAGFETTTNLLGNGLALLFEHPAVRAALIRQALPVGDFVEEVLRFDSPVQLTSRVALFRGLDVDGVPLPQHGEVILMLGAANRDPARFHDPDRFDPWRADNQPLSFGAGMHYCLGAMLARLEARTAFAALLRRYPAIDAAKGAEPVRQDRLLLRGYASLPVVLG
ncbi:cytochrome P450 [Streptacidiphilus carbonis]|uniref:cytochrome P450 n=1 Tax=Streptacidiphilus carbonis TaxID=105422 RepID=UPI0005A8F035|nr:cytochrome P450 [Streptacidiphilus carbonis]